MPRNAQGQFTSSKPGVSSGVGDAQALLGDDAGEGYEEDSNAYEEPTTRVEEVSDENSADENDLADELGDEDSGLDQELLETARVVYDIPDDELAHFSSNDALRAAMRMADRRAEAQQPQQDLSHQQNGQQNGYQQSQQQQQPEDDFELDLSSLADDDPSRGVLTKLHEQNKSLRGMLQQVLGRVQASEQIESRRQAERFLNEGLAGLSELDPILYGKSAKERSASQMALANEVINGPYLDFVRSQMAQGRDIFSLDLRQFAAQAARSRHFEKLTRRANSQTASAVKKRSERVRHAATHNAKGGREDTHNLHPDRLNQNRTLHQKLNAIRSREES